MKIIREDPRSPDQIKSDEEIRIKAEVKYLKQKIINITIKFIEESKNKDIAVSLKQLGDKIYRILYNDGTDRDKERKKECVFPITTKRDGDKILLHIWYWCPLQRKNDTTIISVDRVKMIRSNVVLFDN